MISFAHPFQWLWEEEKVPLLVDVHAREEEGLSQCLFNNILPWDTESFLSLIPACRCYNSTKKNWKRYRRSSEHFWALLNSAYCSCSSTALTLAKGFEQEVFPLSQNFTELNNAVTGKLRILKDSEHGFQKLSWCSLLVEGKKKPTQTQTNKTQEFCVYDFLASLIPPCPSSATSNISLWIPVALKIISCSINWK